MKKRLFVVVLVMALFINSFTLVAQSPEQTGEDVQVIMEFILENYMGSDINEDELYYGALKGLFNALDPYSEFYTGEEFDAFFQSLSGSFYGIGAELQLGEGYVEIVRVLKDTPAEKVGLLPRDLILEVDGRPVGGQYLEEVINQIKGDKGTPVVLTIQRGTEIFQVEVIRDEIITTSVYTNDLNVIFGDTKGTILDKIEYVTITKFTENMANDFAKIAIQAVLDKKEYLIIDLRNNTGGYFNEALELADMLVPAGPIVSTVRKNGFETVFHSTLQKPTFKHIVVLTNEYTASASEIFASAIKESGAGVTIGELTYGKGVVQQLFTFGDSGFKLTVEEYFTRNGNKINGVGVVPDIEVRIPYLLPEPTKKYEIGMNEEMIYYVEDILYYLGYLSEEPDSIYNSATVNAVKAFQTDQGLYAYGVCDLSTQRKLNEVLFEDVQEKDRPLDRAVLFLQEFDKNLQK